MPNKIKLNVLVGNSLLARLAGILLLAQTASADTVGLPPEATKHWTADNGNGTCSNPLFYGEIEDPDIIRFLAAITGSNLLVNVAVDSAGVPGKNVQFQVIDLGKDRVALNAVNGRFVSFAESGVKLKDLAGKGPGEAGSFQWINLMRGDTALLSLVNNHYLTTKPNELGSGHRRRDWSQPGAQEW